MNMWYLFYDYYYESYQYNFDNLKQLESHLDELDFNHICELKVIKGLEYKVEPVEIATSWRVKV